MKVKIDNTWYDGVEGPIMIELTEQDKKNIANMLPECDRYCQYSGHDYNSYQIIEWMND